MLRNIAVKFSDYAMMRKSRGLHSQQDNGYYDIFVKLMQRYCKNDTNDMPADTQIPHIISAYMRGIPNSERVNIEYQTMIFLIKSFNRTSNK